MRSPLVNPDSTITLTDRGAQPASLNASDTALFTSAFSAMYAQPLRSALREYLDNALDAHQVCGITRPVDIAVTAVPGSESKAQMRLNITSYQGLDPEAVQDLILTYGTSTKRGSDELTGYFGFGTAAGLAYQDEVTFISVHDQVQTTGQLIRASDGIGYTCEYQSLTEPTEDSFTVSFILKLEDHYTLANLLHELALGLVPGQVLYTDQVQTEPVTVDLAPNHRHHLATLTVGDLPVTVELVPDTQTTSQQRYTHQPRLGVVHGRTHYPLTTTDSAFSRVALELSDLMDGLLNIYLSTYQLIIHLPLGSVSLPHHRDVLIPDEPTLALLSQVADQLQAHLVDQATANLLAHPQGLDRALNDSHNTYNWVERAELEQGPLVTCQTYWRLEPGQNPEHYIRIHECLPELDPTTQIYPTTGQALSLLGVTAPVPESTRRLVSLYKRTLTNGDPDIHTTVAATAHQVDQSRKAYFGWATFHTRLHQLMEDGMSLTVHHILENPPAKTSKTLSLEKITQVISTILQNTGSTEHHLVVFTPEPIGPVTPESPLWTLENLTYVAYPSLKSYLETHDSSLEDVAYTPPVFKAQVRTLSYQPTRLGDTTETTQEMTVAELVDYLTGLDGVALLHEQDYIHHAQMNGTLTSLYLKAPVHEVTIWALDGETRLPTAFRKELAASLVSLDDPRFYARYDLGTSTKGQAPTSRNVQWGLYAREPQVLTSYLAITGSYDLTTNDGIWSLADSPLAYEIEPLKNIPEHLSHVLATAKTQAQIRLAITLLTRWYGLPDKTRQLVPQLVHEFMAQQEQTLTQLVDLEVNAVQEWVDRIESHYNIHRYYRNLVYGLPYLLGLSIQDMGISPELYLMLSGLDLIPGHPYDLTQLADTPVDPLARLTDPERDKHALPTWVIDTLTDQPQILIDLLAG